jgi:hypothetical protein
VSSAPEVTKQFSVRRNHFSLLAQNLGNRGWLSKLQQTADSARNLVSGDSQMRSISFILAFAFVMVGSSLAGSSDNGLPGIGTFSYSGTPIMTAAPMVVAAN